MKVRAEKTTLAEDELALHAAVNEFKALLIEATGRLMMPLLLLLGWQDTPQEMAMEFRHQAAEATAEAAEIAALRREIEAKRRRQEALRNMIAAINEEVAERAPAEFAKVSEACRLFREAMPTVEQVGQAMGEFAREIGRARYCDLCKRMGGRKREV